jgi:hypothetical protein
MPFGWAPYLRPGLNSGIHCRLFFHFLKLVDAVQQHGIWLLEGRSSFLAGPIATILRRSSESICDLLATNGIQIAISQFVFGACPKSLAGLGCFPFALSLNQTLR